MAFHGRCLRCRGRGHRSWGIPQRFRGRDSGLQGVRRRVGFRDRVQRRRLPRSEGPRQGPPRLHAGQLRNRTRGPLRRQRCLPRGEGFPEDGLREGMHLVQCGEHVRQVPELRTLGFRGGAHHPALDLGPSAVGIEGSAGEGARVDPSGVRLSVSGGPGLRGRRYARDPSGADGLIDSNGAQEKGSGPIVSPGPGTRRR